MNKDVKKVIKLIKANKEEVDSIIVTEDFMLKLSKKADKVKIESKIIKKEKDEFEQYYLFDIPMIFSNNLAAGAILNMKNGENVCLKL